jgi:hypothetical protein
MTQDATNQMQADKALIRDLERAQTPEELRSLLHASLERSNFARDPETGQFARRDPLTPAHQQTTEETTEQISKSLSINGRDLTFTGTADEVERQIKSAKDIAAALLPVPQPQVPIVRQKTQAEIEREICDRAELDLQFRRGQLTTEEYLTKTNAVGEYLSARGFDVEAAASEQYEQSWQAATAEFLNNTPEGRTWKGGDKNMQMIGTIILAHGWDNAEDKVAALRAAAKEMRDKSMEFDGDVSPEQVIAMTDKATPQEILQAWKETQPDPEKANAEFIRLHSNGRSGIFDK